MHYELVDAPVKCLACKAPCTLEQGRSPSKLFVKQHFSAPRLPKVCSNCLLAFLHFCVLMLCNERINRVVEELKAAHGIGRNSVFAREQIYQEAVSKFVKKKKLKVGGNKERCPVDELAVGKVGRMVGKLASKKGFCQSCCTQCLWLAVQTGKDGQEPRSHKDGTKKVAMDVLPDASQAPKGNPRGVESLSQVFESKLRKGTNKAHN